MDYLDPKKKRAHVKRLYVGYALISVAIAIATTILVYVTNGYYIDTKTGQVIQNGLVYLDTKPESASVKINGELQNDKTESKFTIPSGDYNFELNREGYRPWTRLLQLEGGSLRRLTYARLFPEQLNPQAIQNFSEQPQDSMQSIDRKWLAVAFSNSQINFYDTDNPSVAPTTVALPAGLMTIPGPYNFDFIEWADDNIGILTKITGQNGAYEFVLIDRENIANSINLELAFGRKIIDLKLRDRKRDQVYIYDSSASGISVSPGNVSSGLVDSPIITNAIKIEPYANQSFAYIIKTADTTAGKVQVRLKDGSQDVLLKEIQESASSNYLLEIAKLGNGLVVGVSSPAENRALIFRNPINYLKNNPDSKLPLISATLRVDEPKELSFSVDATNVLARNGQKFVSYELEEDKVYRFEITGTLDPAEINWMDGQHFYGYSSGSILVADFEGSNQQILVPGASKYLAIFNKNLERLMTIVPADANRSLPWRLDLTELRTLADL